MAHILSSKFLPFNPILHYSPHFLSPPPLKPLNSVIVSVVSSPERKSRRRRTPKGDDSSTALSGTEKSLRLVFMEELMIRARNRDAIGVSDVIYDMIVAGLSPGPRSYHGMVVAHVLNADEEGAMQSLRRELSVGLTPLHETFVALVRLFGSKGHASRGLEILAAMEKLNYDIRKAWLVLVEELVRSNHLEDANKVFLKGAEGGLRATDEIYDLMIEEDCKAGDHSNALTIAYEMEAAGRMATTFHFNCLLSVQANCGIPEVAFATFENMEFGEDYMKPDAETYNWVIQAYTRAESYDRVQDVAELLGLMVEDYKRIQPNVRTYALLVECFTKYCVTREAIRHFRALKNFEGGVKILHNEGNYGDPLSLYLRALCREGRIEELLEALEAMAKDNLMIPSRAMILSKKYRTLVSSWIEPLQEEADLGYEIDYMARYISEGGLTGERKRWVPRRGKTPLDPDAEGFIYSNPVETSYKQRCLEELKIRHRKLLKHLRNEGPAVLGPNASESDYIRVEERLKKLIKGREKNVIKPKAASKMVVSELKEELEAQGLPIDGTRNVLYQRVDEEVDELISRIKLEEGNTEFWKRRFLGERVIYDNVNPADGQESEPEEMIDDADIVEQTESQEGLVDRVKDKEAEAKKPLQMIGVQLLKDADQPTTSKKSRRRASMAAENDDDDDWFPLDLYEAFEEMRNRNIFNVDDMYTLADAWGWTWDRELKNRPPRRWSQEWEVIELGGIPTIGDCAMILRAAIKAPLPSAFLTVLQTTHSLGYRFGSPLYDEIITLCLDLGELDAAIAIVADLETSGITVPDETLDKVIAARQTPDSPSDEAS
uniref:SAP domain-containing protein n=1 Tax=Chenopodium quinoa TaxID=63459 RepID=A0A803L557_CHEQI